MNNSLASSFIVLASIVIQDSIPTILDKCIETSEISIQLY